MESPETRNDAAIQRLEGLLTDLRANRSTARETEAIREIGYELAIAIRESVALLIGGGRASTCRDAAIRRSRYPRAAQLVSARAVCEHMFVPRQVSILHADLDAFFASVEQRDDPRLRGRPVIVGGGVVLAASYEAKAYGVRTAMGGRQARRLCPHAIVVRPRFSEYVAASKAVFEVFEDTTPLVEGISIDEAFLDVRGLERLKGPAPAIAAQLRRDVLERVGLPITVGVARTKFLAKVASGVAKPDGLLVVPAGGELDFLHPLPVERLWGVGPVTSTKLRSRGYRTVGDVAELGRGALVAMLGPGAGEPPARARAQLRPEARADGSPARLDRLPVRPRPALLADAGGGRRDPALARRPRHTPDATGGTDRPHRRAPPPLRRLHPRDALPHPRPPDRAHAHDRRHGAGPARNRMADDQAARPHARRRRGREPRLGRRRPAPAPVRPARRLDARRGGRRGPRALRLRRAQARRPRRAPRGAGRCRCCPTRGVSRRSAAASR